MTMTPRNDVHRPGLIVPADYRYMFSYSYPSLGGAPGYNLGLLNAIRRGEPTYQVPQYGVVNGAVVCTGYFTATNPWGKLPFFRKTSGSESGCSICGAHYLHGDAWLHEPSGEVVLIGHMCADKMDRTMDRGDWTANMKAMAQLRKTAEYQQMKAQQAEARATQAIQFLDNHEGLREALETDHFITRNLKDNLLRWGNLSEKQIGLAFKLAKEAAEAKANPEAQVPLIEAPTGRVALVGTVLSVKTSESPYGLQTKMLVEVVRPEGTFKVWGTVPSNLLMNVGRGNRISFSANVIPKEPGFGFFSRPTQATFLTATN